ncbi:rho family-interacting cell polarization regulator 1 isoform X2 [Pyxicephalus adspersus]
MSLSVQPARINTALVTRSQSFTGVNSNYKNTKYQLPFHTPTVSRKSGSRIHRMLSMTQKSPPPKVPQPDRVDEMYAALKRGLGAYLEIHQKELEMLTTQIKASRRNSRLGFLYDLDKQVKSTERFLRRLEFHTSKIDELYEAYYIQRRLRDGAHNMVRAYTACNSSKEARESMSEAGKGYKEYTENMCLLENELESQLGEFHIKMKGLAGFARLCAGDQYEIFMRYGRQRWKLKGRIEVNGKQIWDSEDMTFLPLITEFLTIKVTELKSLANNVVVGSVSCETKDLFTALPQVVAVDINDLGTIKLSLEINWNPFDKDDQPSAASTINKASTGNKRFSTYNPSPPDTPSQREHAFYNRIRRQDDLENGAAWSISSESSDDSSSPQLPNSIVQTPKNIVQPAVQAFPLDIEIAFSKQGEMFNTKADGFIQRKDEDTVKENIVATTESVASENAPYSRTLSHISEVSFDALVSNLQEQDGSEIMLTLDSDVSEVSAAFSPIFEDSEQSSPTKELKNGTLHSPRGNNVKHDTHCEVQSSLKLAQKDSSVDEIKVLKADSEELLNNCQQSAIQTSSNCCLCLNIVCEETPTEQVIPPETVKLKITNTGLEDAISSLISTLDDYRGQFPELEALEQQVKQLERILMQKRELFRSRASSISLTVEHALESFNFLNSTSDIEDSECSEEDGALTHRKLYCEPLTDIVPYQSEPTDNSMIHCISEGIDDDLSSGSKNLDRVLIKHLKNCERLLLCLGTFGPLHCRELYALDKLMREAQILEMIYTLTDKKSGSVNTAEEVVHFSTPKEAILSFWNECIQTSHVYECSVETFLKTLNLHFSEKVNSQQEGLADMVFIRLVEQITDQKLPRRAKNVYSGQITIYQYWSFFEPLNVTTLDAFILEMAKEVLFVQNLNSDDQNVVLKTLKRVPESYMQKEGFKTLSILLTNGNSRVTTAVSSFLRAFSEKQQCREKALVSFLEQLEDEDIQIRVAGCAALGCLKAKESIDQLVYLCQTDKDEVKVAAKHSLMLFGEDGKIACRHLEETLESLPRIFAPGAMASTAF